MLEVAIIGVLIMCCLSAQVLETVMAVVWAVGNWSSLNTFTIMLRANIAMDTL